MSETINTEIETTPKTEVKPVVVPKAEKTKVAAPKAEKTKVATPKKSEEVVVVKSDATLAGIVEGQFDATAETIVNALNALDQQLQDARLAGSDRAKEIVKEFGGENKLTDLITKLAGYMGEAAGVGVMTGMVPMIIMAGAAKGIYKKITD